VSVAQRATHGALWNVGTTFVTRAFGLVGTLVLTRFVAPSEYGEVSAALICALTASTLTHLRFGNYLIAKNAPPAVAFNANVVHLGLGAFALGLVVLFRNQLGPLFDAPNMGRFVPGFAVVTMMERIGYIPERIVVRDLQFRPISIARAVGELSYTSVALATAPFFGGMGIVYGNLVRSTLVTVLTMRAARWEEYGKPAPLSWTSIKEMLRYCSPVVVSGVADLASAKWDNLLMSRYFGPKTLGMYNLAYNLVETPTGAVADQVGDVLFPAFSKLPPQRRGAALYRAMRLMALIVFPLGIGLAAVSPTAVSTFFDPRWAGVTSMLVVLSVLSIARPAAWPVIAFLQSQHRQKAMMVLALAKVVMLVTSIVLLARIGGPYGPLWACGGVGLTFVASTYGLLVIVRLYEQVKIIPLVLGLVPVVVSCAIMAGAVVAVRHGLRAAGLGSGWISLGIEIAVGGVVYVAASFVVARPIATELLEQVKAVIARRRGAQ
jgi:PST family polysaccharide transporter